MGWLKPLAVTAGVVGVLGVAGYFADAAVRTAAEEQVARQIQTGLALSEPPAVDLGGVPFSIVFVTRQLPSASLTAASIPVQISAHDVSLEEVEVTASDVVLGSSETVLGSAQGEAVLSYASLATIAGVPIEPIDTERLQASYAVELFGRELVAVVSAVPVLDGPTQEVALTQARIGIAGFDLSEETSQWILDVVVQPIPILLPYDIKLDEVAVRPDGLGLAAASDDLRIPLA